MRCAVALVCAGCDSDRTTDAGRADAAAPDAAVPDAAAVGPGMDDAGRADAAVDSDGGADDVRTADARTVGCWSIDRVAFSSATAIDLALTADGSPRLGVIAEEAAWIVEPADAGRWRTTRVGAVDTRVTRGSRSGSTAKVARTCSTRSASARTARSSGWSTRPMRAERSCCARSTK